MSLDQLMPYAPAAAIVAGVLMLLWGQRDRLKSAVTNLRPAQTEDPEMSPADRFNTFYALRSWCEASGQAGAVKALDSQVLPAIVAGRRDQGGGPSA
ncbi:MAG: hypothetical protein GXY58_04775 [Planctomycetaceae bacterium]|nr:hypothetical protein [Planctomycetaceae bacterium]